MRMGLAVMAFYTLAVVMIVLMMTGAIASAAFKQAQQSEEDQMLRNRLAAGTSCTLHAQHEDVECLGAALDGCLLELLLAR